jgi:hypothetical protein
MSGFCRKDIMRRERTLRGKVEARIAERRDDAFLPREFRDLGGEDQVLRVLREMVRDGNLVRLGYGVYGRAEISRLSGGKLSISSASNGSRPNFNAPTTRDDQRRCRSIPPCA